MRTRLLFILSILSFSAYAQSTKLKSISTANEFEVKFEKNTSGEIEIYITDSENNTLSQRFIEKFDTPVSLLSSRVLKKIMDSSKGFNYLIPNTKNAIKPDVSQNELTQDNVIVAIKKLEKKEFQEFLNTRIAYANPTNKTNYKEYLASLKNVGDTKPVFSGTSTVYQIKRTSATKIELLRGSTSLAEIDEKTENTFLEKLYEDSKANDEVLKTLFTEKDIKLLKAVDYATIENVKGLEELYNKIQGKEKIINYSYLGYVGTNFDLVDGIRAKNLFFATNIMVTPKSDERIGFYISLYGNRTISRIDSIPNNIRNVRVYDSIGNQYQKQEKSDVVKKVQSDNLGAFFSPLIRLNFWKKRDRLGNIRTSPASFYFAPSVEFIWRRTSVDVKYINSKNLAPIQLPTLQPTYNNYLSYRQNNTYNIYDFYIAPIGFWLLHENETISIRLNMNIGYSTRYAPTNYLETNRNVELNAYVEDTYSNTNDIFYTGKLWITERTTGITLQGEINNTLERSSPFYGVTLSKAFDFDKIGNFFKPISNRTNTNTTP